MTLGSTGSGGARIAAALLSCFALAATPALAQAWNHPSFHHPHIMTREFNFGVADGGDAGTTLLAQWREGIGVGTELSFDLGLADPDGDADARFLLGGGLGFRLATASPTMPLDVILTAGLYAALGNPTIFRLPVGVSLGRRFLMEGTMAITPYVHPRVSLDFCTDCAGDDSDLGINFDLGADLELNPRISLRFAALFSGGDVFSDNGFGISLAWKPAALVTR